MGTCISPIHSPITYALRAGKLNMKLSFLTDRNFWLAVTVCAIALMFIL